MQPEPHVKINGRVLTEAQSMAVRVAITSFHMETAAGTEFAEDLGPVAEGYHARLSEVLRIILNS